MNESKKKVQRGGPLHVATQGRVKQWQAGVLRPIIVKIFYTEDIFVLEVFYCDNRPVLGMTHMNQWTLACMHVKKIFIGTTFQKRP